MSGTQTYEYLIAPMVIQPSEASFQEAQDTLDGLAAAGWELVAADGGVAYFKRAYVAPPLAKPAPEA